MNNKYIDKEYQTQIMDEVKYLSSKNIRYEFVKVVNDVTTFKYKKNKELFETLAKFYS